MYVQQTFANLFVYKYFFSLINTWNEMKWNNNVWMMKTVMTRQRPALKN